MASEYNAPNKVAEFLEETFTSFYDVFPVDVARYLREFFFMHLRSWVVNAATFPKGLAMEDVFEV